MKIKFCFILLILTFFSCHQGKKKELPEIEIYLTESRIDSQEGISITESIIDSLGIEKLKDKFDFNVVRLDTINNDLIFAGVFKANKSELNRKPIITTEDIESFDENNGKLVLNSNGAKKLSELEYAGYGKQFVLFLNNEPIIFGYFFPSIYSYWCNTYHYLYMPNEKTRVLELTIGKKSENVDLSMLRK